MKNLLIFIAFILSTLSFNAMSESAMLDLEGKVVVDSAGTEVGDVDRVAMDGAEKVVIIGLRDDQKEVAVPVTSVKLTSDGRLATTLSHTQLQALEDIDPTDFTSLNDDKGVDDPDMVPTSP